MLDPQAKAAVLIEALPYLKRFHGQIVVVKVGGEAVEDPEVIRSLVTDLVWMEQVGIDPILVHGGGKSITRAMDAAGLKVQWNQGRRVTDAAAMEIVAREVEKLNTYLVDTIIELGGAAIGMVPPRHKTVFGGILDPGLGLVGNPEQVDRERIIRYASRGLVPVIPPLSVGAAGQLLNTNAADIALAVARELRASKLLFCSNIPGVCRDIKDPSTRYSSLKASEVRALVEQQIITGGMIPKVQSCLAALEHGVEKIHIIDSRMRQALLLEVFTSEGIGTELIPG